MAHQATDIAAKHAGEHKGRLNRFWWTALVIYSTAALLLSINQIFKLRIFGFEPVANAYYYYFMALYIPWVFIIWPATKSARNRIPWYDYILFFAAMVSAVYFGMNAMNILYKAWAMIPPPVPIIFSFLLCGLILEGARRTGGQVLFYFCLAFAAYPLFAGWVPGILRGAQWDIPHAFAYYAMGQEAIVGPPVRTIGEIIIGFLIFGIALGETGGGKFFLDFAMALVGRAKGGPAKVSVFASALFGTMSGSNIGNVLACGSVTIPIMKRTGYPSHYAAAITSVAGCGGGLMPPVMGAVAFIMASFLSVPYSVIVTVAAVPAALWYIGLYAQVDAYAHKHNLRGVDDSEQIPKIWTTLKHGWFYFLALAALIYFLMYMRLDSYSAFYATIVLLACAMIRKETRFTIKTFLNFIATCGRFLAQITVLLAGVGFITGAMSMTGVAPVFSTELVIWANGNLLILLFGGALAAFILGTGMSISAVYIFLAIVLAPALIKAGVGILPAHFFILYWAMMADISPPVAMATITAAAIAETDQMKASWLAMRLAMPIYFVPFFFVYNESLLLQGAVGPAIESVVSAVIGVVIVGWSLEGWAPKLGSLGIAVRIMGIIGGMLLVTPHLQIGLAGIGLLASAVVVHLIIRRSPAKGVTGPGAA